MYACKSNAMGEAMDERRPAESGFTLVELMIAVLVSAFIMAAVYSAYVTNQKVYGVQTQVVEMQQNLRAAFYILEREVRMAGFDPSRSADAKIEDARPDAFSFSFDEDRDGCLGSETGCPVGGGTPNSEFMAFSVYTDANGVSNLGRSIDDSQIALTETPAGSGHYQASNPQSIASHVEALEFLYTVNDGGVIVTTTDPVTDGYNLEDIISVKVSMVARAAAPDREYSNTTLYRPASALPANAPPTVWSSRIGGGSNPPNDTFRRRIAIGTIKLRNMGL